MAIDRRLPCQLKGSCNPATGDTIQIAASRKLTFVPAKAVKDALNG